MLKQTRKIRLRSIYAHRTTIAFRCLMNLTLPFPLPWCAAQGPWQSSGVYFGLAPSLTSHVFLFRSAALAERYQTRFVL
ncbi:hypothetical protein FB451DRAFT_1255575, partial [Mycena latifolia]